MIPRTLSASSVGSFLECEAGWKAHYFDRAAEISGSAANLGTACHSALEDFVAGGYHVAGSPWSILEKLGTYHYERLFAGDHARLNECLEMLKCWYDRQDWEGRVVLTTEVKETFPLPTSLGPIPVTYIFDRLDRMDSGAIVVTDYKSVMVPVTPAQLRERIQPRLYALAAAIRHPEAPEIWVEFDLLRHDRIGARFSREDNVKTWHFLREVAERIIASDGSIESLNPSCRWCVRALECNALASHDAVGGILSVRSASEAAEHLARLEAAKAGITTLIDNLNTYIFEDMERNEILEFSTPTVDVAITGGRQTREIDAERAAKILGPELMARYGNIGITQIDEIVKLRLLAPSEEMELKGLIRKRPGKPRLRVKAKSPFATDE